MSNFLPLHHMLLTLIFVVSHCRNKIIIYIWYSNGVSLFLQLMSALEFKLFVFYEIKLSIWNYCVSCASASNGNPRLPDSLHYLDPSGRPNAYQRVRTFFLSIISYKFIFFRIHLNILHFLPRQSQRSERYCRFMTLISAFLHGVLGQDQSMVLSHIVST